MTFDEVINITTETENLKIHQDKESPKNLKIIITVFIAFFLFILYLNFDFFLNMPSNMKDIIIKAFLILLLDSCILLAPLNFIPYFKIKTIDINYKTIKIKENLRYTSEMIISSEIKTSDVKRAMVSTIEKGDSKGRFNIVVLELKNKKQITLFDDISLYSLRNISREINIFINKN